MSAYAAYRMKLDDTRRPLRQTMARTALVSGIVAATFFASFAIAMSRLEALIEAPVVRVTDILDEAVQRELPRIVGRALDVVPEVSALIDRQLQNMSLRFSDYLEEKVDAVIEEQVVLRRNDVVRWKAGLVVAGPVPLLNNSCDIPRLGVRAVLRHKYLSTGRRRPDPKARPPLAGRTASRLRLCCRSSGHAADAP